MSTKKIVVRNAPEIPGLSFRGFRGEADYPAMSAVINGSKETDGLEWSQSVEDVARNYRHLVNSDPERDMLFAEIDGHLVGYSRVWWMREAEGTWLYKQFVHMLPEWRKNGLRRAMLRHNERRLREIVVEHRDDSPHFFEAYASDSEDHWTLPEGLEVRPVEEEHIPLIWAAAKEAFRDHWGYSEDEWDQELASWREAPTFQPHLWQIAWAGDQVAGMVQNFVDEAENEEYGRKRGYTEGICVRRPWRRQGLAKALIARSFRVHKALGMEEAALGVDADNPNGALQLYKSMGFQVVKRLTTYRKPLGS
jgi:mycothiol synthase